MWSDIFSPIFNHDSIEIVSLPLEWNFFLPFPWVLDLVFSQCPKYLESSTHSILLIYLCPFSDPSIVSLGLDSLFFSGSFVLMKLSMCFVGFISSISVRLSFSIFPYWVPNPYLISTSYFIHQFFVLSWISFEILFFEFFENISNPSFELFV